MIKVCLSRYGKTTGIYRYINPNYIIQLHREDSEYESNIEAELVNGEKVIILDDEDLLRLVGPKYYDELKENTNEKQ